ncbi:hypothetical protein AMTR_s00053p00063310 [Amborella trichopoda]|uniref:GDSL esterase/lipase n=1 Tax=Amborella trichopoda TaxID=13333 RepID=W1P558_AMBTC|nr:hypothetical protein AMTR_s00053p00063310 [Amborella trichopoda]
MSSHCHIGKTISSHWRPQALGLPFLSPYLQSLGSNFRHGANYATLASTVLLPNTSLFVTGISPFSLAIQLNQMKDFKARVIELQSHGMDHKTLPLPDVFGKSLYTFDIGQNDFTSNLAAIGISGVQQYLPKVASQIVATIKELYDDRARTFLVSNLAPIGCFPAFLTELPHNATDLDGSGCMISYNNAVAAYNFMLNQSLDNVRKLLPNATLIYVDTHAVKLELFQHPAAHGFKHGTKACCGTGGGAHNFNPQVFCGNSKVINGSTLTASACPNPQDYVSWDGIHLTEAANMALVHAILGGSYFYPSFPLGKLCHLHTIG